MPVKEPVGLQLERYSCRHARRGRCVIINNHHFNHVLTSQQDREGTEVDAAAVESLFVSLGFEVMRYDDLTINDMSIQLREGRLYCISTNVRYLMCYSLEKPHNFWYAAS